MPSKTRPLALRMVATWVAFPPRSTGVRGRPTSPGHLAIASCQCFWPDAHGAQGALTRLGTYRWISFNRHSHQVHQPTWQASKLASGVELAWRPTPPGRSLLP